MEKKILEFYEKDQKLCSDTIYDVNQRIILCY